MNDTPQPQVPGAPIAPTVVAPQVSVPQPIVEPKPAAVPMQSMPQGMPPVVKRSGWMMYVVIAIILIVAGGAVAFAAKYQLLPFGSKVYTTDNFFSSILAKSSAINSASYKASSSLSVGNRDKDAVPFSVLVTNTAALREQYQNDSERAQDVSSIMAILRNYDYYLRQTKNTSATQINLPTTLQKMVADMSKKNSYYKATSITDPVTGKEYEYKVVNGGNDFNLTVTFETDSAITAVRKAYGYVASTTIISGKNVTFTKNSIYYFYLPTEPPKPLIVQLGESLKSLPSDVHISFDAGAQADFTSLSSTNWLAQFNAEGSFGDLSYKVNAEARKKDQNYYVRINNIPSLVGSYAALKGQWIKISAEVSTSSKSGYDPVGTLTSDIQSIEKAYKENRATIVKVLKKAAEVADQEKIISFKSSPKSETVDGRSLTRYDVQMRKEAILPFYQKFIAALNNDSEFKNYSFATDEGLIEYLKSAEFNQVFDYINKNVTITFWVDKEGYPAIAQYGMRIVPPETATQLEGKQVNIIFKLMFDDINKPVKVDVPAGARPLSEVFPSAENTSYGSGDSIVISSLAGIRADAELVYGKKKGEGYGANPFALGACKQTAGTLFEDKNVFAEISKATNGSTLKATCISTKDSTGKVSAYAVSAPLVTDPTYSWCVNSTGTSKQIKGIIKTTQCK